MTQKIICDACGQQIHNDNVATLTISGEGLLGLYQDEVETKRHYHARARDGGEPGSCLATVRQVLDSEIPGRRVSQLHAARSGHET